MGVAVTRPTQELILMRGIPGSGKSTKAKTLVGEGIIHSTDELIESTGDYRAFFAKMNESKDFTDLSRMHSKNLVNAKKSMSGGITPIVIDNTNLKATEPKAYVVEALKLGYADENIKIVDVGTGGLDAKGLFERNTHGVPLDKIESMIQSHKTTGTLNLKKILEAKDMYKPKVLYSAVVLTPESRNKLLKAFEGDIPLGWDIYAHHMTIIFGQGLPENMKHMIGKPVELITTKVGISDMAIAVLVSGIETLTGKPAHITIAVNTKEGGKPVMSGDITKWKSIHNFKIVGVVTEVKTK